MLETPKYIFRFLMFAFAQTLIIGQLDFGLDIHPMIYPFFILILPFEINTIWAMIIAFLMGIFVDFFMNTFGLHASAALIIAYLRPQIFSFFAPRDGYDNFRSPTIQSLGYRWFLSVSGLVILFHHFWFFLLEQFKFSDILIILKKTILSGIISIVIFLITHTIFFKRNISS